MLNVSNTKFFNMIPSFANSLIVFDLHATLRSGATKVKNSSILQNVYLDMIHVVTRTLLMFVTPCYYNLLLLSSLVVYITHTLVGLINGP